MKTAAENPPIIHPVTVEMKFNLEVRHDGTWWVATVQGKPGLMSQSRTMNGAINHLKEDLRAALKLGII